MDLGWVDLDLGSSLGWWAATVATYCPSRMVEHPKCKSTKPSLGGHGTPCRSVMEVERYYHLIDDINLSIQDSR